MDTASVSCGLQTADHLCVLVHGLWGNPQHLNYLSSSLRDKYAEDRLHILVAKRNAGSFTYDGIELGGERVTQEIEDALETMARSGQKIKKLSIVGYSLGGLVARYAIGLLYSKGWFDKLEPVNFTTFATPHLGIRTPLLGYRRHLFNVFGARVLAMSGRQLFTIDSFRDTGKPLLSVLADPSSVFMHALRKFKTRSLYCNIINDRSATFYTTGISKIDPFANLNNVEIRYIQGYEQVIVDASNPVSAKTQDALPSFYERLEARSRTAVRYIPILLILVILVPIGTTLFLINSAVQTIRSRQRIRLHEEGKAGIGVGLYRIPLMVNDVRRTAEDVIGNINSSQSQEYLPAGTEELADPASQPGSPNLIRIDSVEKKPSMKSNEEANNGSSQTEAPERSLEFPTLALTAPQFAMIQALDEVGWKKYPVHIHLSRHSHAAIIVRKQKKTFEEGKLVVKHWLSNFEI